MNVKEFTSNWQPSELKHDTVKTSINLLDSAEFPTRKDEDWKYTRVGKLLKKKLADNAGNNLSVEGLDLPELEAYKLVFVNGRFISEMSDEVDGILVKDINDPEVGEIVGKNLGSAVKEDVFSVINSSFFKGGLCLYAAKNAILDKPVHLVHLSEGEGAVSNLRNLIVLDPFAEVELYITFVERSSAGFTNSLSEVVVGDGAKLNFTTLQLENNVHHINSIEVKQAKDSTVSFDTITIEGNLIRNNLNVSVEGQNCETNMNGIYVSTKEAHIDNHTRVDHKEPNCTSNELYKGVLGGKSTGVFNGKVFVHQDAQKIEAYQQNRNVLISDDATINAKPELEIYADDVKCSHGTTTGQFDEEAIFYLQARGVSKDSAKRLLIEAFSGEVIAEFKSEVLQAFVQKSVNNCF